MCRLKSVSLLADESDTYRIPPLGLGAQLVFHWEFEGDQHINGLGFGCRSTPFGLKYSKSIYKGTFPIHFFAVADNSKST